MRAGHVLAAIALGILAGLATPAAAAKAPADIVSEDFLLPARDPGLKLFVRNKHRAGLKAAGPERTLLFLHGAGQPSEATFDLRLDGLSWADYMAARGWDVWLMDLRGYGGSTKPAGMSKPPMEVPAQGPLVSQVSDFDAVADFILARRKIPRLNALAWSWGNVVVAHWAVAHPDRIGRIAMFGPAWLYEEFPPFAQRAFRYEGTMPGWTRSALDEEWTGVKTGAPPDRMEELSPPAWRKAWETAMLTSDPDAAAQTPPQVRTPSGPGQELRDRFRAHEPIYPAGQLKAPVLVAVGQWDGITTPKSALALLGALENARERRLVVLGGATHAAFFEPRRLELFSAVADFLEENQAASTPGR